MLSFFFPQVLERAESALNGEIKVVRQFGHLAVWVGGFEQSGPIVRKTWQSGLARVEKQDVKSILVLGVGCGVILPLLAHRWPEAAITGVEIDPVMLRLGRKYFELAGFSGKVLSGDANKLLETLASRQKKFDLVIVDLYLGGKNKDKNDPAFVRKLYQTVSRNGLVIFNILTIQTPKSELRDFLDKISPFFAISETVRLEYNKLYFLSRKKSTKGR